MSCGSSNGVKCDKGFTDCAGICVDLTGDKDHCGACRTECLDGEFCGNGVCTINCTKGEVDCNGQCVNQQSDDNNCGACGTVCFGGKSCLAGICQTPPTVTSIVPDNNATATGNTTVTVNFSESVTVTAGGISLGCPRGTDVAVVSQPAFGGTDTTFVLTPQASLPAGECSVTVTAADVKDANGLTLLADIVSSFVVQ